jgi:ABC-type transport system involved in multi-copper enzyme maturation permease subunit
VLRLLHSEWFRLRQRAMPWLLLGIFLGVVLLIYLLMWFVLGANSTTTTGELSRTQLQDALRIGAVNDSGLQRVEQFGLVFTVILAASIIATEFSWGTIRTILPRSSGRAAFLTVKLIVAAAFAAVVIVAGFGVSLAASAGVTWMEGLDSSLGPNFWLYALAAMGRVFFVMLPFVAMAAMVSLWTRSSAAGIGVTLGVMFLEPVIMSVVSAAGGFLEHLPELFFMKNVNAVLDFRQAGGREGGIFGEGTNLPNPWQAASVLLAYTAAFCGLTYWRFLKRDIQVV